MDELDLLDTARRYFEAVGPINRHPDALKESIERARPLSTELNRKMDVFRNTWPNHECALFIAGTISIVARSAKQTTLEQRLATIDRARADFTFARARLDDMVAAALDENEIEAFNVRAKEAGFESTHSLSLYGDDGGLAGWQIHLR